MESAVPQTASADVALPSQNPQLRLPQLTFSNLKNIPNQGMAERKKSDAVLSEPSTGSRPLSTRSSLFSQETRFSQESRTTLAATLMHPSPPQTPKTKPEWEDKVQVDLVPWRTADRRKHTHPADATWDAPAKRRCSESDEDSYSRTLPSMNDIFRPRSMNHRTYACSDPQRRWSTPSASPEPPNGVEYTCSRTFPICSLESDLITRSLNALRRERDQSRTLPPLPQPMGLSEQPLPSVERLNLPLRGMPRFLHYQHDPHYRPQQLPSPPREVEKKKNRSKSDDTHINVKYATEELDYIRYQRVDKAKKWIDTTQAFKEKFPIPGLERTRQGIQGGYYRQNDGQVPKTTDEGRVLCFLPNGHVKPSRTKVREQRDKKLYGLAVLFPERAMNYPWVDYETRQVAIELAKNHVAQKEQAKRAAIYQGTWVDKGEDNSCACCFKEDRESSKRAAKCRNNIDIKCGTSLKFEISSF